MDDVVIAEDWSAIARGRSYKYEPVRDGNPSKPWIAPVRGPGAAQSLAFQVPTDLSGHKERIEYKIAQAADADGLHFDNARYSGFSFQLAAPAAPFLGSAIIYQGWQGYPFGPPVSLKLEAGTAPPFRLKLAVRNSSTGPDSVNSDLEAWSAPIIQPGVWYDVAVFVEPRYAGPGQLKLWVNGAQVADWSGPIGYDPAEVAGAYPGLDVKDGIYQPDRNNGHTFYFDRIVFGADAASVGLP